MLITLLSVLVMIIGFGALIFVHELGHFIAAKWAGIRTEAFAIGMGPTLLSWRKGVGFALGSGDRIVRARLGREPALLSDEELRTFSIGETEYSLRVLPIGGFVKMLGQDDADPSAASAAPRSYQRCSIPRRMVVISAGVLMNLLLALVLFIVVFMVGVRLDAPVIGAVDPSGPAGRAQAAGRSDLAAGLRPGDRVVAVDDRPVRSFADVQTTAALAREDVPVTLRVSRPGVPDEIEFSAAPVRHPGLGLLTLGFDPARSLHLVGGRAATPEVERYLERAGLLQQGVRAGMTLAEVDGITIGTWSEFDALVRASGGRTMRTTWTPAGGGAPVEAVLAPLAGFERLVHVDAEGSRVFDTGLAGMAMTTRITGVPARSLNAGVLMPGDEIARIGTIRYPRWTQLRDTCREHRGRRVPIGIRRDGQDLELEARVSRDGLLQVEVAPIRDRAVLAGPVTRTIDDPAGTTVAGGRPDMVETAAARMDVLPGAVVRRVEDRAVSDWTTMREALRAATQSAHAAGEGAQVTLEIDSGLPGAEPWFETLPLSADEVRRLHALGWTSPVDEYFFEPLQETISAAGNPLLAVAMGFHETRIFVLRTYLTIDRLLRRSVGIDQLRGPIGIIDLGTQILPRGFLYFLLLLAMISVNLAVLNFLPLPIVDGGHFLYLVYERITGRPPSVAFQNAALLIGLAIIGALFVVTFYNDVARLFS